MSRERLQVTFGQTGLAIELEEVIGCERLEHLEETFGFYSRELMRLARMQRAPERFKQELGPERYQMARALYTLSIYLLIGKLVDVVYMLRK
jgi:hypothetical protein